MKEYFIRITPENTIETISTENPDIDFYYQAIGCRCMEIVRGFAKRSKQVAIVDEESLCKENPRLNVIASFICGRPLFDTVLIAREDLRDGEPDIIGFTIEQATAARLAMRVCLMKSGLFEDAEKVFVI